MTTDNDPHEHPQASPETDSNINWPAALEGARELMDLQRFKIEALERGINANRTEIDSREKHWQYLIDDNSKLADRANAYEAVAQLVTRLHDVILMGQANDVYKIVQATNRELRALQNPYTEGRNVAYANPGGNLQAEQSSPVGLWPQGPGMMVAPPPVEGERGPIPHTSTDTPDPYTPRHTPRRSVR